MVGQEGPGPDASAQAAADRLAVAFEEVGFDVGRAFPMLTAGLDRRGAPAVELGRVTVAVSAELAGVLTQAARLGVTVPDREP